MITKEEYTREIMARDIQIIDLKEKLNSMESETDDL